MNEKTKKFAFLGLSLLPFVVVKFETLILLVESMFYGTMYIFTLPFHAVIIHWICTIIIWCFGLLALYFLSKKAGYNIFENKNKPTLINWIIVVIIIIFTVAGSYIIWGMRFKPFAEYKGHLNKYDGMAIATFIFQYLYYIAESMLFLAIVIFAQKFGEMAFMKKIIPWGGIMCGLTWGLGHILTQDLFTGIYSFFVSILFGIVYLQMKKNVKYAYIIIALMFML
jgi:hypothetical protein